jgi:D-alanyl-D-alanine carboxypeptidase/D-alanyl-D-alanine-endopeptidase (penicillin-binding protein 4)
MAAMLATGLAGLDAKAQRIEQDAVALPDLEGGRWGVSIMSLDGEEIYSVASDQRFAPASTLKLITTLAAFDTLGGFESGDWPGGTSISIVDSPLSDRKTVILRGSGDPTLSSSSSCEDNCLWQIADAIEGMGLTEIETIDVDDSLFLPPHWPMGWSHEDFRFGYATAISALSVDDGVARARLTPGNRKGQAPGVDWDWAPAFQIVTAEAETVSTRQFSLDLVRRPGARQAFLVGKLPLASPPVSLKFGLDDPGLYAGKVLKSMLENRGITVHGPVVRSSISYESELDEDAGTSQPIADFRLAGPDIEDMLEDVLHRSNNFYTEVLLHHVSLTEADRSQAAGIDLMEGVMIKAGSSDQAFNFADGSGLSVYDRMTPASMTKALVWASKQAWYPVWSGLLSRGGSNGTLQYRFRELGGADRLRAKTGSLTGTGALAGFFESDNGTTYAFVIFANDSSLSSSVTRRRLDELLSDIIELVD